MITTHKLYSEYKPLVPVQLPLPQGRQKYMHSFDLGNPSVPMGFEDYLMPVRILCASAGAFEGEAHLTIDEKIVLAGMSQRRPRPHVDGCFSKAEQAWGHGGGSGWLHGCNNVALAELRRMPVIVAASAAGCRVWRGVFHGTPGVDGDLSHIADQLGKGEIVPPDYGYLLSADCVHESMVLGVDTPRTFMRIALPNDRLYL